MTAIVSTMSTAPTTTATRPKQRRTAPAEATAAAPAAGGRRRKAKGVERAAATSAAAIHQTEPETGAGAEMDAAAAIASPVAKADLPATKPPTAQRISAKRAGAATSVPTSPADPAADDATAPDALPRAVSVPPAVGVAQSRARRPRPKADPVPGQNLAPLESAAVPAEPARKRTKSATLVTLLQRAEGASLAELMAATGWLAHSVRAALSGLRKQNRELSRHKDASGASRYHLPHTA